MILGNRWLLESHIGFRVGSGSVQWLHVAGGVQARGTYSPALLLGARFMAGDALRFLTDQHPSAIRGPTATVGLTLAPARFRAHGTEISLGSLYAGIGSDFPGWGTGFGVTLFEIATEI